MRTTDLKRKKHSGEKIAVITCYDYPSAAIVAKSHMDAVLVGDSVAMAVHGHKNTTGATMEMMVLHTEAVARGLTSQLLIADLPFLAHRQSRAKTVDNVRRLVGAGAEVVKIEGGDEDCCRTISCLVTAGVPVIGHIGLTPQSIHQLGGFKVQGKGKAQASALVSQAKALEAAGCVALVIECVPQNLARQITEALAIPTIGIGAGRFTDGQVLVWHDLLGLQTDFNPRFLKRFANAECLFLQAIESYASEVHEKLFPTDEQAFSEEGGHHNENF